MRFLLELVPCCGSPTQHPPQQEEERWLVPAPPTIASRPRRLQKRGRKGGHDWRPSLGSISEDIVVSPSPRDAGDTPNHTSRREIKRTSSSSTSGGAAKVRHRSYSGGYYDCRPAAMPTIMPTFSPTPFMF